MLLIQGNRVRNAFRPACPGGGRNWKLLRNALYFELSVGLVPAEAREGQLEEKRCNRPDKPDGVLPTFRFCSCQLWSRWHKANGNLLSGHTPKVLLFV